MKNAKSYDDIENLFKLFGKMNSKPLEEVIANSDINAQLFGVAEVEENA